MKYVVVTALLVCSGCASDIESWPPPSGAQSSGVPTSASPSIPPHAAPQPNAAPTPTAASPLAFDHVFVIVLENHSYDEIVRGGAPYLSSLASTYASAGSYRAVTHPSEPNYLAMTAGDTFGVQDDSDAHVFSTPLITDRVEAAGKSWKAYMQSMPAGLPEQDAYPYAKKHDPFAFFTQTDLTRIVSYDQLATDLSSAGSTPAFAYIVPDLMNDMHDGSVAQGDAFVKSAVETIVASPAYQIERSLVVIVFDEDDGSESNQVPCIFVAKNAAPGTHGEPADHYALLRTLEDALGVAPLGAHDAQAQPMASMLQ